MCSIKTLDLRDDEIDQVHLFGLLFFLSFFLSFFHQDPKADTMLHGFPSTHSPLTNRTLANSYESQTLLLSVSE